VGDIKDEEDLTRIPGFLDRRSEVGGKTEGAEPAKPEYGAKNKIVTNDRADEIKKKLRDKLLNQISSGFDPEILALGTELAVYHIEAGARVFADFSKAMINDLGEAIRPYLRNLYEAARKNEALDVEGMDTSKDLDARHVEGFSLESNNLEEYGLKVKHNPVTEPRWLVGRDWVVDKTRGLDSGVFDALLEYGRAQKADGHAVFDGNNKVWRFDHDPTEGLRQVLPEPPVRGGGTTSERREYGPAYDADSRLRELRGRFNDRPDESRGADENYRDVSPATVALIERGLENNVPERAIREQVEDIGAISHAYKSGKPLFLLASEAGTGKTFVMGGAIREVRAAGAKKIIYVTERQQLVQQFKNDLKDYGVGDIETYTYASFDKSIPNAVGAVVIFDEAHNIKNVDKSKRAQGAQGLIEESDFSLFASATPFEDPTQAEYLEATGIFNDGSYTPMYKSSFWDWALAYGAYSEIIQVQYRGGGNGEVEVLRFQQTKTSKDDARAARDWFRKQGIATGRPLVLPDELLTSEFVEVGVADDMKQFYDRVEGIYDGLISGYPPEHPHKMNIGKHKANTLKRILEDAKRQAAALLNGD